MPTLESTAEPQISELDAVIGSPEPLWDQETFSARDISSHTDSLEQAPADFTFDADVRRSIEKTLGLWREGRVFKFDLISDYQSTPNNKIELFVDGTRAYPELFKDIDNAASSIHVSYYIFRDDMLGRLFVDKLIAAHERGVEVRVQFDMIGSRQIVPFSDGRRALARLAEAGVDVLRNGLFSGSSPEAVNNIDHRKLCVIDGKVAYTGGMNMASPYLGEIHDLMVRVQGQVVRQLQSEWINSWLHNGGTLGKSQDKEEDLCQRYFPPLASEPGSSTIEPVQSIPGNHREVFLRDIQLIRAAKQTLYLEFPYLTDERVEDELSNAAKRGVDVRVILPGRNDNRFADMIARHHYDKMLRSGCKIYDYPGFCHGKAMVVDGVITKIGTSNLDPLSLSRNYELDLQIDDPDFAAHCTKEVFERDLEISRPIKPAERPWHLRIAGGFMAIFAPWS